MYTDISAVCISIMNCKVKFTYEFWGYKFLGVNVKAFAPFYVWEETVSLIIVFKFGADS